jgi:hypothetical protein
MSQIQAIETEYKGYLFRSRLEARWAVFFDTLGIEWKYESEGYKTANGEMYLPDFVLPGYGGRHWTKAGVELGDIFVEVKGDPHGLVKDFERQVRLHDWGGVLPNFADSYGAHPVNGLLLLGEIPEASQSNAYFHPIIQHYKGLTRSWAMFTPHYMDVLRQGNSLTELLTLEPDCGADTDPNLWRVETRRVHVYKYYHKVYDAYAAARSARFEHGQSGRVTKGGFRR